MAQFNPRNNGGTAHLFGTTKKLGTLPRLGEPQAAERAPAQQAQSQPSAQTAAVPVTFAQMQAQGQARPNPPAAMPFDGDMASLQNSPSPSSGDGRRVAYVEGPNERATRMAQERAQSPLMTGIRNALSGGTPAMNQTLYDRLRETALANMDADFGARRQSLDEEMARRGLYSSSIAGGRMGDLEGQYARARGSLEADLLGRQVQDQLTRDQMFMQIAQALAGMKPEDLNKFLASTGLRG